MLATQKDNLYFVRKIYADIEFILKHTKNISEEALKQNEILVDSVLFRFIQISENIKRLTNDFKLANMHIPWLSIIGLRNKIVHEYGDIRVEIIYQTIQEDLVNLCVIFQRLVNETVI